MYLAADNRNIEGGDYPVPKADMDHLELIELLLQKGAAPNARVKDNTLTRTIFTMQWFYENGATAFVRAAQSSDTALMKLLVKYGADPRIPTAQGDTALTAAAGIGWVDGVTYERSPAENLEAVRMLLDLGLDPNAANNEGRTPLLGAALKGPRTSFGCWSIVARRSMPATEEAATRVFPAPRLPASRGRRSITPRDSCAWACSRLSSGPRPPR